MKIYRGPSTKEFEDPSHEEVAAFNLNSDTEDWHESLTLRANVTKDGTERRAVAHVNFPVTMFGRSTRA
jgi:hypothetical protein